VVGGGRGACSAEHSRQLVVSVLHNLLAHTPQRSLAPLPAMEEAASQHETWLAAFHSVNPVRALSTSAASGSAGTHPIHTPIREREKRSLAGFKPAARSSELLSPGCCSHRAPRTLC
jgi:hypothetical protein